MSFVKRSTIEIKPLTEEEVKKAELEQEQNKHLYADDELKENKNEE